MLNMAFWKKRSGTFEPSNFGSKNCKYGAYYLGKMEMDGESGFDCTMKTVNTMYKNYKHSKGKNVQRMAVTVAREGVVMGEEGLELVPNGNNLLPVVDISFGTAVPGHEKIFVVVVRNGDQTAGTHTWHCHGFLCDTTSNARDLTLLLVKAFQRASAAGEITQPTSVDEASKQSKPTTLHILHERGKMEHQRLHRTKSAPAVSTIRVTLNVEYRKLPEPAEYQRPQQPKARSKSMKSKGKNKEYVDPNKAFAEALAKRDRERGLGLIDIDKPSSPTKKRESLHDSSGASAHPPLRRAKSDSEALQAGKAKIAADKENLDHSSESEKDSTISENGSTHNSSSDFENEQDIVVAINPLMSILKNPSRPLRPGRTTTVAFKGEVSPRPGGDSDEESGSTRKSVRFSENFKIIEDD